jgi:hypothetical protein
MMARMSIEGHACIYCRAIIGKSVVCPGCDHIDPPTVGIMRLDQK